jgi:hypothetical protein
MSQINLTDLIVGEVSGELDTEVLREAALRCMVRHPGLRARVRWPDGLSARPRLEFLPPDASRVSVRQVLPGDDDPDEDGRPLWQRVADQEAMHRFDPEAGYLFRVAWVPRDDGGGGHLILNASHVFVDGVSLMRLLHEMIRACAVIRAGRADDPASWPPPLPITAAALSHFREGWRDAILSRFARAYVARRQRTFPRRNPFPIHRPLEIGEEPQVACLFRAGHQDNWHRVRAECRARGVTVGGAYAAAVQFAALRDIYRRTGRFDVARGKVEFPLSMDYSLRRLIPGAHAAQEAVGLFTGISEIGVKVPARVGFWELARTLRASTMHQLDDGTPVLFQRAAERVGDLEEFLRSWGIDHAAAGGAGEAAQISNVGAFPYPVEHGPLRLDRVFGCNGPTRGGPMFMFWIRSINDHFCYNATATTPAVHRHVAETLFDDVVSVMERCAEADVAMAELSTFVRG